MSSRRARPHPAWLLSLLLAVTALVVGCSPGPGEPEGGPGEPGGGPTPLPTRSAQPQASVGEPRVLATGLEVPWGIDFLPGGDALITERDSTRLLRVSPEGEVDTVTTIDRAQPSGEGGLLGLAVSPDFPSNHWVYLYYSAAQDNRIVRFTYEGGELGSRQVLVSGIPKSSIHNGGRLAFGPDGFLYATTGEAGTPSRAQDRDSLGGKILRVTPEGRPAPDNPFESSPVYSLGHRNVEGLAFGPGDGLYVSEFGENAFDEVNRINAGNNYGWPEVEGFGEGNEFTDPLLTWRPAQASPAGAEIAGGSLWVAALRGERLWRMPLAGDGSVGEPSALYTGEYGRLRTVIRAPSGDLWLTTSNRDGRGSPRSNDDRILVLPLSSG